MQKRPETPIKPSQQQSDEEGLVSRWSRRKAAVAEKNSLTEIDTLSESQSNGELVAMIDPEQESPDDKEEHVLHR